MIPTVKQVHAEYPWLQPEAIRWLESVLQRQWTVLETGMGGSTIFFARRARLVISYENVVRYFDETLRRVARLNLDNVEGRFRQEYPVAGLGDLQELNLVMIDGRGRVRSVLDAAPALVTGGWLVLDDSHRPRYEEARRALSGWKEQVIFRCGEDETRAWRKP